MNREMCKYGNLVIFKDTFNCLEVTTLFYKILRTD